MNPLQQPAADPFMAVTPADVGGLASVPFVMAAVDALKALVEAAAGDRKIPSLVWPFVTYLVAMTINCGIAALLGADPQRGVLVGILAGMAASGIRSQARSGMDTTAAIVPAAVLAMLADMQQQIAGLVAQPEPEPPADPPANLPTDLGVLLTR